ncbi:MULTISPECIES: class II glutamine amidotransferase [Micrococcaceae]|uniref:Glutamine amidotransferases class-II n=1 Tax=Arthrobacter rhombi TaxID=71253 RepID=A0A1R4GEA0_9MICC|nr:MULTISPECIES: class II glutamine amidotransferase [Micrococcaceae]PCC25928.1 class II glutamine amidotransferase [Glutamicibacter sp. BW78]SJM66538.1 Glutamine amidotransferases class-II [Arthrobacter rhombi]
MCRWLAYVGSPITMDTVLTRPNHSLLDQSLLARDLQLPSLAMSSQFRDHAFPTNGDGFGLAWAGVNGTLGQYREITPAWDSQNLRHLAAQISSGCFLAHVRAAPGGTIAQDNCHPFVHAGWMFQHNGDINGFSAVKRELTFDVAPELYPFIRGNSDTEVCFFLALTYGLATDPVRALTRMILRIEQARKDRGLAEPFRATIAASDGERLYVLRWVSPDAPAVKAPSLFHSSGAMTLHVGVGFGAGTGELEMLPADAQLVASEPLELHWSKRHWVEVPPATVGVFTRGHDPVFTALETTGG